MRRERSVLVKIVRRLVESTRGPSARRRCFILIRTIGHRSYLWLAVWCLTGLTVSGTHLFGARHRDGSVGPAYKVAHARFEKSAGSQTNSGPQHSASHLVDLARARYGEPWPCELKLLRAAPKGEPAFCGPSANYQDSTNDPAKAASWRRERQIRAALIRWLCVDREAATQVDPRGILVVGAKIVGPLDLSFVDVPFPLGLFRCRLTDDAYLYSARIPHLNLQGTWVRSINAAGADVKGYLSLRNGFRAEGEVRLLGAQIGGNLSCVGGTFKNPPKAGLAGSGNALIADGVRVTGGVLLREGFKAEGEVRLLGAQIGSNLECDGGTFKNPPQPDIPESGKALNADGVDVKGYVLLRSGFRADGEVRLPGAQIGRDLMCSGGTFTKLYAQTAVIKGNLWIDLLNAKQATISLTNASAGAVLDSGEASWPDPRAGGELRLDGFVYGRISGGPTDARTRLEWLSRQKKFTPQPYRQLAKVLREAGDDRGAGRVLYEMERRRHREAVRSLREILWGWVLRPTIGYGYYPSRAIWGLVILTFVGTVLFGMGYLGGSMTPTEKDAYTRFGKLGLPPDHYPRFNAPIYSLENSLPLVKLGQDSYWTPKPNPDDSACKPTDAWPLFAKFAWARAVLTPLTAPGALRWFRWVQILAGWILATLFLAGVSGIVRKD